MIEPRFTRHFWYSGHEIRFAGAIGVRNVIPVEKREGVAFR